MALKIIGAGFGRTGTLSVYTALNELGFSCYHMFEVLKNQANNRIWIFGARWRIPNLVRGTIGIRCFRSTRRRWTIQPVVYGGNFCQPIPMPRLC
ncbi:MAG: sulfotransferase [Sulfuricaulis sp.]